MKGFMIYVLRLTIYDTVVGANGALRPGIHVSRFTFHASRPTPYAQ